MSFDLKCGAYSVGQTRGFFGRSGRMLRAKTVTFLRTESGLSAVSSIKGDISRHFAVYARSTFVPHWGWKDLLPRLQLKGGFLWQLLCLALQKNRSAGSIFFF